MKRLALLLGLTLAASASVAGKLYKWVDQDGRVHYTDQLPPPEAKAAERKSFKDSPGEGPLPYALQMAIKNFPATLFKTSDCGDACAQAAALLSKRGVPYTDKDPRDPAAGEELKALTGGKLEVPVLKLGGQVLRGYEQQAWHNALDAAGYPKSASLPPSQTPKSASKKRAAPAAGPAGDAQPAAEQGPAAANPAESVTPSN
jgi:glutaredoxin